MKLWKFAPAGMSRLRRLASVLAAWMVLFVVMSAPTAALRGEDKPTLNSSIKSPLSPQESLAEFKTEPDLRIELVAAEPQVVDPVAIAFDEHLRLWVVEMGDYPNGPKPGEQPKSRIRLLEDKDGDGYYETSHIFVDHLLFATGVQPWRGGVIVTLSGRVAYFRDTDGDKKADVDETWFSGFAEQNPQLRANHPTFALDNHIYVANGLRGGDVIARKDEWSKDAKPVSISGMDFRFDPLSGKYEAVSGNGQFGLTFDDFGNRFVCSNRNPCTQVMLEDRYLKRNPFLAVTGVTQDVSPAGEESHVYPISRQWTTSTLHAGQFTAACGVTIYRGDLLPREFQGNSFTCEPTGNLVHRDALTPAGASFTSKPAHEGVEFLASRDEWFRPVNLANGPDGALYVVDMYRAVIEHPEWVPDELKNRPDNYLGNDRGRIYRIVPKDKKPTRDGSDSLVQSAPDSAALVEWLASPNAWRRETAARLIYEGQDKSLQASLQQLAQSGSTPQAKIHALWALDGLGVLEDSDIKTALRTADARIQVQALRLAEPRLKEKFGSSLGTQMAVEDPKLRFQLALALGEFQDRPHLELLAEIAVSGADDRWMRLAAASSTGDDPAQAFVVVVARAHATLRSGASARPSPGTIALISLLAEVVGSRQKADEIHKSIGMLHLIHGMQSTSDRVEVIRPIQVAGLIGLGEGVARRGGELKQFVDTLKDTLAKNEVASLYRRANEIARKSSAPTPERTNAVRLLRFDGGDASRDTLLELAAHESDQSLRLQAIGALASYSSPQVGKTILADFSGQTPTVRSAILDTVLSDSGRTRLLLDEIEAGRIRASEIDVARSAQLAHHGDKEIQARAKQLLASSAPAERKDVLETYGKALTLAADSNRGREVFRKNCMTCHRIGEIGVNVAPDIADSRTRTPVSLLTDILDPNRAIDNNYFSYTVVMFDGKSQTGIVAAETATSITLKQQEGKVVSILRQDVDEMHSNGVSLMPVGLEKNITVEEMGDLISFIKNWRYLDGRVPIEVK